MSAATVGPVFSPPADISCNHSRFCLHPTDVLYRQSPGPSRLAFGIIQTTIGLVSGYTFPFKITNGQGEKLVNVQLIVEHMPEECMYPHSEIKVLVDGIQVGDPKPKPLRSGLREELRLKFRVIHLPRPDFTFDEVAYERTDVTFRGFVGAVVNDPRLIKEILGTLVRKATTKRKLSDRVRRSIRHSMPH